MVALATLDDLEPRLGRTLLEEEIERGEAILDDVSAVVRNYTGQQFTLDETTERIQVRNGVLRLPQRPVVDVSAVENTAGTAVAFSWYGGEVVTLTGYTYPLPWDVEPFYTSNPWLDVTYEHGYETVPDDVVAVVCQIAGRAFGRNAESSGVTQEAIAGYSYSVGAAGAAGAAGMLADERRVLDKYRRAIGSIRVAM